MRSAVSKAVMIHPDPDIQTQLKAYDQTLHPSEVEGEDYQVERNTFGYLFNVILATGWFSLLLSIFGTIVINKKWDILGISGRVNPIFLFALGFASLLLGSFHAYVLHFDSYEKNKKETDDLKGRIIGSWPLVLGTVIYAIVVGTEIWKTETLAELTPLTVKFVYPRVFNYYNLLCLLLYLNVPLTVCAVFLAKDSSWNVFNAWSFKAKDNNFESEPPECRVVGFVFTIILAFIWLLLALIAFFVIIFANVEIKTFLVQNSTLFLIHIGGLAVSGVHVYTLCTPKFDSGQEATWKGFIKKNWLMVSGCATVIVASLTFSIYIGQTISDFLLVPFFMILSLSSCSITMLSNKSPSNIRCFKPWNLKTETAEDSVQ